VRSTKIGRMSSQDLPRAPLRSPLSCGPGESLLWFSSNNYLTSCCPDTTQSRPYRHVRYGHIDHGPVRIRNPKSSDTCSFCLDAPGKRWSGLATDHSQQSLMKRIRQQKMQPRKRPGDGSACSRNKRAVVLSRSDQTWRPAWAKCTCMSAAVPIGPLCLW
jgi:hypothetical protein